MIYLPFTNRLSGAQTETYFASQRHMTDVAISELAGADQAWKTIPS